MVHRRFLILCDKIKQWYGCYRQNSNKSQRRYESKALLFFRWFQTSKQSQVKLPGITLIELVIYVTIFGVISAGIFTLVNYVQTTNVKIINTSNVQADVSVAQNYVRSRLGRADDIEVLNSGGQDNSCLQLNRREARSIAGYWFDGSGTSARASTYNPPSGNSARAVSLWIYVPSDHNTNATLVRWGRPNDRRLFQIMLRSNGIPHLDFNCANISPTGFPDLRDNDWHHIVVSYDGTTADSGGLRMWVDNQELTFTYNDACPPSQNVLQTEGGAHAQNLGLVFGALSDSNSNNYKGAISDLRIWNTALTDIHVAALFNASSKAATVSPASLEYHVPLATSPDNVSQVTSVIAPGDNATLMGFQTGSIQFATTVESTQSEILTFRDADNDDRFDLWHNANSSDCAPDGSAGWQLAGDDIFTPGADGFFSAVSDEPSNVSVTFGYEDAEERAPTVVESAGTRRIALSRSFKNENLCRPASELAITASSCMLDRAFALISTQYDNTTDSLAVLNATRSVTGSDITYSNIPFADAKMRAVWSQETGVLTFSMTDNSSAEVDDWVLAMQNVVFKPTASSYSTFKNIMFGVGQLPFEVDGDYHYYEFVTPRAADYDAARNAAKADSNMLCGMRGYLATVTSQAENDFLGERFLDGDGNWPRGFLGATDTGTEGVWKWMDGPDAGVRFWQGNGSGDPILDTGTLNGTTAVGPGTGGANQWTLQYVDLDTSLANDLQKSVVTKNVNVLEELRFTNWAQGEPNNCCGGIEHYLQISGMATGHGLWNDMSTDRACSTPVADAGARYDVCGYYVEWGGSAGDADIVLADVVTVDLEKHRDVCEPASLNVPPTLTATSGIATALSGVFLTNEDLSDTATVTFDLKEPTATVSFLNGSGVTLTDNASDFVTLTGTITNIQAMINSLVYTSPSGYFGADSLEIIANIGSKEFTGTTLIDVQANCGGETNGTAVRLDLGVVDDSNNFIANQYVTMVSKTSTDHPQYHYGYCRNGWRRYNKTGDGSPYYSSQSGNCPSGYNHWTGRQLDTYGADEAVSIMLYEESDRYTKDRYGLWLMFDDITPGNNCTIAPSDAPSDSASNATKLAHVRANQYGLKHGDAAALGFDGRPDLPNGTRYCHLGLRMSNIDNGRQLDNSSDIFTFADDAGDFVGSIGDNGTAGELVTFAAWNDYPDGVVIPLTLPDGTTGSALNPPDLANYDKDADGDGISNPRVQLEFWDSVDTWNIRALNAANDDVVFRSFTIDSNSVTGNTAIEINIDSSQRCPTS